MSGWWSERFASFELKVTPGVAANVHSISVAKMNLPVTPTFTMAATGQSTAAVDLNLTPSVSFVGVNLLGLFSLNLVPALSFSATGTSTGAFTLGVTPGIGMAGVEHYSAQFGLTVTPTLTTTAYIKQLPHPIPWTL